MSEITIRNKGMLDILNSFSDEMLSKPSYDNEKYWTYRDPEDVHKGEYFCSRDYLEECLSRYPELVGPPDRYFAQPISKMVREEPKYGETLCRRSSMTSLRRLEHTRPHYSPITRQAVLLDGILTMTRTHIRSYLLGLKTAMGTLSTMIRRLTK